MCNDYRQQVDVATVVEHFRQQGIEIDFPYGMPNLEARQDIRITDTAPIVRAAARGSAELVQRRWSWPGHGGKPVYNFRSEGREFTSGRCLIVADGFYEFTQPIAGKKKLKDKWLFTKKGELCFCIAGIWRADPNVGEAFTMLTLPPGPDIAPFHDRQIAVLARPAWADWLDPCRSAKDVLRRLPDGSLAVEQVG